MNDSEVLDRLRGLPPQLADSPDRFAQVQARVRRRRLRQLAGAGVSVVAACSMLAVAVIQLQDSDRVARPSDGFASDPPGPSTSPPPSQGERAPGSDRVVELSSPLTTRGTGTETVQLGDRPSDATAVSTDLTCLTAGTFTWPNGASLSCNAEDAAASEDGPTSPGYIVDLEPGQEEITITAGPEEAWEIVTTYVRTERVEWGENANGETYGVQNEDGTPDLIAVGAPGQGVSYARSVDLDAGANNPEEAGLWMANGAAYRIPTYAQDGTTIRGTFDLSAPDKSRDTAGSEIRLVNGTPPPAAENASVTGLLAVTDDGCVRLTTPDGALWLILPWGVHLAGTPEDGQLQALDGTPMADLNANATMNGKQVSGQKADANCGTNLPPLYVDLP